MVPSISLAWPASASLVNQTTPSAELLVMQYIQCCGGSGLVYDIETKPLRGAGHARLGIRNHKAGES